MYVGVPLPRDTDSKLVIHKDFNGQWASHKDKMFYDTVQSGESMTVFLSIVDLGAWEVPFNLSVSRN